MQRVRRWLVNPLTYLPPAVNAFLGRRVVEGAGVVLVALAGFGILAVLSWSIDDPSLNNATTRPPGNWMGLPGAYVADILLQTLGLACLLLLLPPFVWGIRAFSHRLSNYIVFRVAAWLAGTLTAAAFLGALPRFAFWPLALGLGGVLGDALAALGLSIFAPLTGEAMAYTLTALIAAPAAFFLILFATDTTLADLATAAERLRNWRAAEEEEEEDRLYTGAARPRRRGALADEPVRPHRPDVEPSRLRILMWEAGDRVTDWRDRFLRRGDYAPLTAEEIEAARQGRLGEFGRRSEESASERRARRREARVARAAEERIEPTISEKPAPRVSRGTTKPVKPSNRAAREAQPKLPFESSGDYQLPPLNLLTKPKPSAIPAKLTDDALQQNARLLESVLDDFGIRGEIISVNPGPVVTLYELEPAPGIKSSRVISLADDIARSMSAVSTRVAVVPGRNAIGIELPNARRETVYLRELLETQEYENSSSKLTLALGKNINGEPVLADLTRMPHLLIAGTTGSGKSVGINTMILSLLYRMSPEQCKLIMIDPKMLELSVYDGIPHLLAPVVTEPKKAVVALKWVVKEMEDRYRKMSKVGVRNIDGYNTRVSEANARGEVLVRTVQTGFDKETGEAIYEEEEMDLSPMPFIVVIVDEMADLMMVAGKEIEAAVQRLAQMARAAGIHIVTATQRPSVDVITGTIKANFPTRISFQVTSKIDSRTILGEQGAEQLLGQGDMLYMAGGGRIRRVHGPFVSDEEVEKVVSFLKRQGVPEYLEAITAEEEEGGDPFAFDGGAGSGDDLYDKAVAIVARDKRASTSYIQRRLQIGYNRAARLIELMEEQGVVSPPNHQGKREVLVGDH
ncbi:DNA translocase FtsK 4TM domain-containing protein [Parvibaculum sp.]|uniref:FtsK/SpoIIIE family DNA translocase n=1 Tax=Parvibaculum sp. TaxID=2024848 RepID=UPI002730B2A6|nr:DNA translocase FtsK 4TM domain-containing protein [Parvibaculum sp.]MDP1625928.1 DNA translocase FtsK 4TM domain-containing protein [Parvibaculum sp.]MDP2149632.1 DNA translocase FtsK 4TM domain-containing protein [Parvibaculum sp.]MDP3329625.1 DNA translocase FtsK 4TM domain-containing protein [Parvibaculum sp.]